MSKKIKVCSFNVRTECDASPNSFTERAPLIKEIIVKENPDLIGFQEVSNGIYRWMKENLTDGYIVVGTGREKDYRGERTCIAYRKYMFEAIEVRSFMLSNTPTVFGSRFENLDQSACPRVCTAVNLVIPEESKPFWFYNTHLDHIGAKARLAGAKQILDDLNSRKGEFILTGDMNAEPETEEMKAIREYDKTKVTDVTACMKKTFHNYGKPSDYVKIDYIYTNAKSNPEESYLVEGIPNENGTYPSDHSPVFGYIEIE